MSIAYQDQGHWCRVGATVYYSLPALSFRSSESFGMLAFLLSLVNPLTRVAKALVEAKAKQADAQTEQQRIEAEVAITQLEARQTVLIAEQANRATRWIRPAFALPFVVYNFKVVVWDKVLGLGTTDVLSDQFWQLQMIVFGAYFVTRGLTKK